MLTPQALEALITGYTSAWGENDPLKRRALLEEVWEADGVYTDPQTHAPGRDALDAHLAGFQASIPGATFTLNGAVDHHHNAVRFFWTLHMPGGQEIPGMDYGEISPDGKLSKIVGFF
jgi:hypothetical protein